MMFADRMLSLCQSKNSRLVVGLDPHWDLIPASFKAGFTDGQVANLISGYLNNVIDVTHDHAVAYKPQIAFFEQFGLSGLTALLDVLDHLHHLQCPVIMDAKRNDIGSTAAAYARTFFGDDLLPPAFPSDALTVNGYLGSDGIKPFLKQPERGIFVLVKTSNPSSGELQDQALAAGNTVAEGMADLLEQWNGDQLGEFGYGNVGAVVGATYPEHMRTLRQRMPHSLFLVPGYGAQGGSAEAVRAAFDGNGLGALINSSRGILFPPSFETSGFEAVREAAVEAKTDINRILA
ncbi:orotidine-5'-phosphate decarboxylase [Acanthopleuribacter pedis]|uniref:Orotidine 5'-phosphate decarboxylase n=1 Tax=Acanthopleuribacter pedis TaxID=442870 RepID=A0A8J7Q8K7_9BACT|nr:orotidine-5'-phosphate decarboxylase [Acanthopleuribacter pedis]MBO1320506.1 orotidine-5'-phosphate decarboxylase [Acanthopleuribacter pedis]